MKSTYLLGRGYWEDCFGSSQLKLLQNVANLKESKFASPLRDQNPGGNVPLIMTLRPLAYER